MADLITLDIRDMVQITNLDQATESKIDRLCSYKPTAYWFIRKKFPNYDGVHLYRKGIFPIGLLSRVKKFLDENGVPYQVTDNRPKAPNLKIPTSKLTLRPYQQEALEAFEKAERFGILNAATGSGKTVCGISLIQKLATPTIIFVPTQVLLYQWRTEIEHQLGIKCGIIGDGKCIIEPVTVAMYQTVAKTLADNPFVKYIVDEWKMEDDKTDITGKETSIISFIKGVGLAILDESHFVAAKTFIKVAMNTPARYKLGLSATALMRPDGANLAVIAGCGEVFHIITTSELIVGGYLSPLVVKIVTLADEKLTKVDGKGSKQEFQRIKREYILKGGRNSHIVKETKQLLDEGRTVLVLVTEIEHGKTLKGLLEEELKRNVVFLCGSVSAKKRMATVALLKSGTENLVITTSIFEYGLDIPRLSGLVIASPSKSMIRTIQRVGRILRPFTGKPNAKIVDFDDTNADYFREHFIERMKFYSAEPEFKLEYDGKRKDIKALVERSYEVKQFLYDWERGRQ